MILKEIENIIIKYLNRSVNSEELDKLSEWIKKPANHLIFEEFVKANYVITISMNNSDSSEIKENLLKEIRRGKKTLYRVKFKSILKYAATAVLLMGIIYSLQLGFFGSSSNKILIPEEEYITIELENGNVKDISENSKIKVVSSSGNILAEQEGVQIVYNSGIKIKKLAYNTLKVPYGKRFRVKLSDGTEVSLNAGTSFKYPVQFIDGKNRQVFLVGEAYFDVTENKSQPFVVNTNELNIQVVGTEFNVTSYREDRAIDVVLVKGSVGMHNKNTPFSSETTTFLKPSVKGSFNRNRNTINTSVVDTDIYTSWIKGNVIFRNTSFKDIIKKLERLYNVKIISNNSELAKETFNANIDVDKETIEDVLNYFDEIYNVKYSVINNKIIIE